MRNKAIQLVENLKARAICESTPRYDVILNGQKVGQLYFNMRGYVGTLPCPPDPESDKLFGSLDIGEVGISAYQREVARLNKEWAEYKPTPKLAAAPDTKEHTLCIQCRTTDTGLTGTFICVKDPTHRIAISPLFDGLHQLYPWMKQNGWESAEYVGDTFVPWRVRKGEPSFAITPAMTPPHRGRKEFHDHDYSQCP